MSTKHVGEEMREAAMEMSHLLRMIRNHPGPGRYDQLTPSIVGFCFLSLGDFD